MFTAGAHHRRWAIRSSSKTFQPFQSFDLLPLRLGRVARAADRMCVGLVVVLPSQMERNHVIHLVGGLECGVTRVAPPLLSCTHDLFFVTRDASSEGHFTETRPVDSSTLM